MIKCFVCPLNDICTVPRVYDFLPGTKFRLNWLPDGNESECPLYRAFRKECPLVEVKEPE